MRILFALVAIFLVLGVAVGYAIGSMEYAGYEERFEVRPPEYRTNPYVPELEYPTDGTPVAKVAGESTFEFGIMQANASESHAFVIENEGDAPLRITLGDTTCKCTVSGLTRNVLPPGETATVELTWTPKAAAPEFKQSADVHTNDPKRPTIALAVTGRVLEPLWIEPQELSLPDQDPSEAHTLEAFVFSMQDRPLDVDVELTRERLAPHMRIETEPATAEELAERPGAEAGVKLKIVFERGFPLGPFKQEAVAVVKDGSGGEPTKLTLPMSGRFVGDLRLFGPAYDEEQGFLVLGEVRSAAGKEAKLNLLVKGEDAADIDVRFDAEASDPPEAFEVEFGEKRILGEGAVLIPVTVRVKPGLPAMTRIGSKNQTPGQITLETTHPDFPTVPIWVRFSVMPQGG